MLEKKSVLLILAFFALLFVCVPSVLFNNAIFRYLNFIDNWSVASIKPSRNAQFPPMHPRAPDQRADMAQPELRFVKFAVKIANAKAVNIAGDFNKWNKDAIALVRREKNTWVTIITLPPGVYQYLYNIDGQLILDPLNPDTAMSGDKKVSVRTVK
jgi:hypothetical protein